MKSFLPRLVVAAALSLLVLSGCESPAPAPPPITPAPSGAVSGLPASPSPQAAVPSPSISSGPMTSDIKMRANVLKGKLGNGRSWELESQAVHYDDLHKTAVADGIKCVFHDPKAKQDVVLTAEAADVDLATQALRFRGKVVAQASSGARLEIGHLRWDGKTHKFYGTDNVRLTRGQSSMTGDELVADMALRTVELKGNVRIYLKDLNDLKNGFGAPDKRKPGRG